MAGSDLRPAFFDRFGKAIALAIVVLLLGMGAVVRWTPSWTQPDRTGLTFGTVTTPEGGTVLLIATTVLAAGLYLIVILVRG